MTTFNHIELNQVLKILMFGEYVSVRMRFIYQWQKKNIYNIGLNNTEVYLSPT